MLAVGSFFFAVASALLPFLNVEFYLIGIADRVPHLLFAVIAGVGQTVGKVIWFYAGQNATRIKRVQRTMESEKWQASYQKWHGRIVGRPVMAGLICFASAFSGFPPLAVVAVLVGALRMNLAVFIVTVAVGRTLRFWVCLASGSGFWEVMHHWFG